MRDKRILKILINRQCHDKNRNVRLYLGFRERLKKKNHFIVLGIPIDTIKQLGLIFKDGRAKCHKTKKFDKIYFQYHRVFREKTKA